MSGSAINTASAGSGLRRTREWLEHAVEHIASPIYVKDRQGCYHYANSSWEQLTGRSRADIVGRTDIDLFGPQTGTALHEADLRIMECGLPDEREERYGERVYLRLRTPLIDDGAVVGLCSVASDISERKVMEQQSRDSDLRYRKLFDASADAVMLLDADQFLDCNPSTLRIFGCRTREEFLGKHPGEVSPPVQPGGIDSHELADERIGTAFATGRNFFEWTHRRVDSGESFPAEVLLNTVELGGRVVLQAVVRDVSARKRTEEDLRQAKEMAEAATRMKSSFLANMSHELRTPLNAIIGFTGTMLMRLPGPLTADQEHQLNTIKGSALHLLSLINDMLDLAKIEAGRMELRAEPINANRLLTDIADTLRPLAERKNLTLETQLPTPPVEISVDVRALKQIVLNLGNNAIKFTEKGSVTLSLRRLRRGDGVYVELAVADTGIGIRAADRERLFQAFSQVDGVLDGTGLGLHLSQRFAQLIGGRIELDSEHGKGSRFALLLPVER